MVHLFGNCSVVAEDPPDERVSGDLGFAVIREGNLLCLGGVGVDVPAEVAGGGFVDGGGDRGEICGDVMFEAVFADVAE
jgi:hypothetical protein